MGEVVGGFGIYVHWPYCSAICPYCDFNVRRDRGGDHGDLLDAIVADLSGQANRIGTRGARSLFIGGGTPSLLQPRDVARLIAAARAAVGLDEDAEISLECNPEDRARFADFHAAGVTRFSLGLQALRAPGLLLLGRRHSVREGLEAVERAAATGARVSIDLIYGRDGQSTEDWRGELSEALALGIEHLSLYQLTIEAGTPFARAVARGRMHALDAERGADLYALTQELCEAAGFPGYEISNHARHDAAQSRHNLVYWRSGDWIGVGPGAHGRITLDGGRTATCAYADPQAFARAVAERGVGWERTEALDQAAIAAELALMGLRLREGVDRRRWAALSGGPNAAQLAQLIADGFVIATEDAIRLTPAGRPLADRIAAALLA
ncbi:MAG: radical SAM family heme chaperone HemW [Hydrogenophilaceae bacterium]|jgi:oxygen-independent coproporphyrinogen-3 oxidase|nr:radical SAM family heme chaperone HemW [Hydrogenophilaceae bacterium]